MRFHHGGALAALALLLAACGQVPVRTEELRPAPLVAQEAPQIAQVAPVPSDKLTQEQIMAQVNVDHSVFFPAAGTELDAVALRRLAEHAERLKADGGIVTLYGYTDHLGSPSYNLAIAEQRVNAVASVLRRHGVAAMQIRRNAVGSERVPTACRSVQCRQLMRRVELVFGE